LPNYWPLLDSDKGTALRFSPASPFEIAGCLGAIAGEMLQGRKLIFSVEEVR
jgi:hypothetical protein